MKNPLSLLKNIISSNRPVNPNVKGTLDNLFMLYDKIEKYYSPGYGAKVHIFKHPSDMDTLLKIIPEHAHDYLTQLFYRSYADFIQEHIIKNKLYHLKENEYPEVFFSWRNEDGRGYLGSWGIFSHDKEQEFKIKRRYNMPFTIYRINEIKESELFKGGVALRQILELLNQYKHHPTMINIIDQLSSNQDFVDFTIKCQTIANDPDVFKQFIKQDEEWHNAFFAPVHFVNDEAFAPFKANTLALDSNAPQASKEDLAEARLHEIMKWSSSKFHVVETPSTHTKTIADELAEDTL